jgi:uncharacterized membrane protein YbhN (UPF0104 family)
VVKVATHRNKFLIALGGAASLALLAASFRGVDLGRVSSLLGGLGTGAPFLLLPSVSALVLETHAWQLGLSLAGHRTRLLPLWGVRVASESIGAVLPLGAVWADALKPPLLAARCGVPVPAGVAAVAIRKYLLVLSQAGYLAVAFIAGHEALRNGFAHATGMPVLRFTAVAASVLLAVVATSMAAVLGRGTVLQRLMDALENARFPIARRALGDRLTRLRDGALGTDDVTAAFFRASFRERARPLVACLSAWLLEATETWFVLRAVGATVGWGDAVGIEAVVVLSRHLLPFLPGGLGVQELGYTALLGGIGCDVDHAMSLIVLKRVREAVWVSVGAVALSSGRLVRAPEPATA